MEAATASAPPAAATALPSSALRSLLLLGIAVAYASATRAVFSPLQELAKADLALSDFQLSLVQGLATALPVGILSIPLGRLVDRAHRMRLLKGMAGLSILGTVLTVLAQHFTTLFLARMLVSLGTVSTIPVAISVAADLSRPEQRGRSVLCLSVGNMVGGALAFALGGWLLGSLAAHAGTGLLRSVVPWRGVHFEFAAAGVAILLCLNVIAEPERRELGESAGAPLPMALRALWARRALLAPLFVGQVTVVMADAAAVIWAAPVLQRSYGQRPEEFAGWVGLVILIAGLVGSAIGGVAADRGQRSHGSAGMLTGAIVAAAVSIPAAFYPVMPAVPAFAVMFGILLLCGAVTGLITATAIAVLVPNELRGICLGAFMVVGGVIGFGVAPTLVSVVSTLLGGEGELNVALGAVGAVTSVIALTGFLLAARAMRARVVAGAPPSQPI